MLSFVARLRVKGQLKSPDISVRSKAVEALARNASDPAAVRLLVITRNKEGGNGVGDAALKALESVNDARAVDALLESLRDGTAEVRCATAKSLGNIRDPKSVGGLCAAAKDANGQVRWAAAAALGNIGDKRAVNVLSEALSTSLTKIKETHKEELVGWCNTALATSKALGQIGDKRATEVLVRTLREGSDWQIKRNSATSLGQLKDVGATDVLVEALGDRQNFKGNAHGITWEVQAAAAEALGHIGGPRATEALTAVNANTTLKEAVRRTAQEALNRLGPGGASTQQTGQKKPYLMSGKEMAAYLHKNILGVMLQEISRTCQKDGASYCSGMAVEGPTNGYAIVMDQLVLAVEFTRGADWRPQQKALQSIINQHLAEPGWRLVNAYPAEEPSRNGGVWVKFGIERK